MAFEVPSEFRASPYQSGKGPSPRHPDFLGVSGARIIQFLAQEGVSKGGITRLMKRMAMPHRKGTIALRYNMGRSPKYKSVQVGPKVQEALAKLLSELS